MTLNFQCVVTWKVGVAACLKVQLLTVEFAVDLDGGLRWEMATLLGFDENSTTHGVKVNGILLSKKQYYPSNFQEEVRNKAVLCKNI
jgi:hypothetical protein